MCIRDSAIIAATVPVWGMSWYFDTENWAAGIWNSWAEERTDTWRAAMAAYVRRQLTSALELIGSDVPARM